MRGWIGWQMSYVVTTLNSIVNSGANQNLSGLLNALTACPLPEPKNARLAVLTFQTTFANSQLLFCDNQPLMWNHKKERLKIGKI